MASTNFKFIIWVLLWAHALGQKFSLDLFEQESTTELWHEKEVPLHFFQNKLFHISLPWWKMNHLTERKGGWIYHQSRAQFQRLTCFQGKKYLLDGHPDPSHISQLYLVKKQFLTSRSEYCMVLSFETNQHQIWFYSTKSEVRHCMHIYKNFVECTVQSEFWMYIMQQ